MVGPGFATACDGWVVLGSEQLLAVVVVFGATLTCVPLARSVRPGRLAVVWAVGSALVTVEWFLHKAPYEGPAILTITATRGMTLVDLIVPPSLAISAAVLVRAFRR